CDFAGWQYAEAPAMRQGGSEAPLECHNQRSWLSGRYPSFRTIRGSLTTPPHPFIRCARVSTPAPTTYLPDERFQLVFVQFRPEVSFHALAHLLPSLP